MAQQRVYNFGDLLTQGRTKTLAARLLTTGLYEGMQPTILSSALLQLEPGAFLLPNGVLVTESTAVVDINYPTPWPPSVATDYTLTADHTDIQAIGGSVVTYTIRAGLLPRSGSPNASSLALLWIRHPGSAPLDASMFSSPAVVKNGDAAQRLDDQAGWLPAPYPMAANVVAGPNIQQSYAAHRTGAHSIGLNVVNTAGVGQQTLQFTLSLPTTPRARSIEVYADIPILGSIGFNTVAPTISVAAAAGASVTVSVTSSAGIAVGDKLSIYDPATLTREIVTVTAVPSGTQFTCPLINSFNIGSVVTSLSVVTASDGTVVASTPSIVNGPITALGTTPAATFVLSSTASAPATLGIKLTVPPGGSGNALFLKGFRIIGD